MEIFLLIRFTFLKSENLSSINELDTLNIEKTNFPLVN